MKIETIEKFYNVGNILLEENFNKDEAVLIAIVTREKMRYAIKGKNKDISYLLYRLALDDNNFFHLMKLTIGFIEKEKAKKIE